MGWVAIPKGQLATVVEQSLTDFDFARLNVTRVGRERSELLMQIPIASFDDYSEAIEVGRSFCRHVNALGHVLVIDDLFTHPLTRYDPLLPKLPFGSLLAAPTMTFSDDTRLIFSALRSAPSKWTDRDLSQIARCALEFGQGRD